MSIDYFAVAQFLQSGCASRCIEFIDGAFFCADEEVTGKKFIVDLRKLNFGVITREGNGTVIVREGQSLWDWSPERGDDGAEQAIVLLLEDLESGAPVKFVADSPDGKAAIGRLCNVYGRHCNSHDRSNAIIKLTTCKHRGATGYSIKLPELAVMGWEGCHRSSDFDDGPPF